MKQKKSTSWEKSSKWYQKTVGDRGHYYHEHVILPSLLALLDLKADSHVLDLGAGQGVLARRLPPTVSYTGIDISPSLINLAKQQDRNKRHTYNVGDVTKPLSLPKHAFTHVTFVLSIQNMENFAEALQNASIHLLPLGKLAIVLNHPCFRIPRQSGWGTHLENKLQYRYVNRYMSDFKIPISMHPGSEKSPVTWSFHHSLTTYTHALYTNGFVIERFEEWTSDKESEGRNAKMENQSRAEIPLFLTIIAIKYN